ncbi:MAG TPA: hypothetical protein VFM05_09865, partial [Candidatus Saccharimonadales bacterium]|nr:hypothetical protein [Candidatus Saccharimonadales bacterium]
RSNPGFSTSTRLYPERVIVAHALTLSALMGFSFQDPGLSLRSNPGLKLANAFGVSFQIQTNVLSMD